MKTVPAGAAPVNTTGHAANGPALAISASSVR